jgi:hypothetical protein
MQLLGVANNAIVKPGLPTKIGPQETHIVGASPDGQYGQKMDGDRMYTPSQNRPPLWHSPNRATGLMQSGICRET